MKKRHLDEGMARSLNALLERRFKGRDVFLSPNEIGDLAGITGEAVKQWVYRRVLPATKMSNGFWKISSLDLQAYCRSKFEICQKILLLGCPKLANIVKKMGYQPIEASKYADGLIKALSSVPSLFVIASSNSEAFKFIERVRKERSIMHTPIMIVGELTDKQTDIAIRLRVQSLAAEACMIESEAKRLIGAKTQVRRQSGT